MANDNSPTNKTENVVQRNVTTRANKRQALGSPPLATTTTEGLLSRDDIREIVQEVVKAELSVMMAKLSDSLKSMLNMELQPVNAKIDEMDKSMKFISNQYEDLLKEHTKSKETLIEVQKENSIMKNTVSSLKVRLDQLEQQTRSNNVEIQCVPERKQEDLFKITSDLVKVVGCDVGGINPDSTRPRSIIVQLASPRLRDEFLASVINFNKKNSENKLNSTHLGYPGPKTAIYVTEHLSPTHKALHAAARLKAKELGFKFIWIRGGRIFMRKTEESEHIMIRNMDTLNKLS
uniref:FP protein C-terminal domain-containing protein n=1 Tax=Heliothis virescens TaxID=7102 RepID=A0A2A4IZ89_HELVI